MPSPFPGMNPYLEHPYVFHDFHNQLITAIQRAVARRLPVAYTVQSDATVYIHEHSAEERRPIGRPDVLVSHQPAARGAPAPRAAAAAAAAAPARTLIPEAVDVEEINRLLIRDTARREVVTVVELLSHTNKLAGGDREAYVAKRRNYLHAGPTLVEIDLLRAGKPMPLQDAFDAPYRVVVARAESGRPRVAEVWPIALREPLPVIPVPLRPPDADVTVDLQALLQDVYDASTYDRVIYEESPQPRLSPDDHTWADALVAARPRIA